MTTRHSAREQRQTDVLIRAHMTVLETSRVYAGTMKWDGRRAFNRRREIYVRPVLRWNICRGAKVVVTLFIFLIYRGYWGTGSN